MAKNRQKCPKRQKFRKTVKKTVKNDEKKLKILKNSQKTVKNVQKEKMSKNCQKNSQK